MNKHVDQMTFFETKKCCVCGRLIPHGEWGFMLVEGGKEIDGPYCSKACAPDAEAENISNLETAEVSTKAGTPWYAVVLPRLLATIWYLLFGGFVCLFGGIISCAFKSQGSGNIHGGCMGKVAAAITAEKYSYIRPWNFNYK